MTAPPDFVAALAWALPRAVLAAALFALLMLLYVGVHLVGVRFGWWSDGEPTDQGGPR